jgi:hypothetical protein
MKCPKCNARIGLTRQRLATDTGIASGTICYICGYWKQESLKKRKEVRPRRKQAGQRG